MGRRAGEKKIDALEVRSEGNLYVVDIYMIRGNYTTTFEARNQQFDIELRNEDIDVLRKQAAEAVRLASASVWEKWIEYHVQHRPRTDDDDQGSADIQVKWKIVERCDIGKATERHRYPEESGRSHWTSQGAPEIGEEEQRGYRQDEEFAFSGVVPFNEHLAAGLNRIQGGIGTLYHRLLGLLCPGKASDPQAALARMAAGSLPILPEKGHEP